MPRRNGPGRGAGYRTGNSGSANFRGGKKGSGKGGCGQQFGWAAPKATVNVPPKADSDAPKLPKPESPESDPDALRAPEELEETNPDPNPGE